MGIPQPSKEPEWASANPTDPVSGQPAIIEPSEGKKDSGHTRIERPPRQDHNWLFNLLWQWQKHFKSKIAGIYSNLGILITESGQTPDVEDTTTQLLQAFKNFLDPGHIAGFHLMDTGFQLSPREHSLLYSNGICLGQDTGELIHSIEKNSTPFPGAGIRKTFHIGDASYQYGDGGRGIADGLTFIADTSYHVFVFYNVINNLVDIALDTDLGGANVQAMSGVIDIRRIGSVRMQTNILGFVPMRQIGDLFFIKEYLRYDYAFNVDLSGGEIVDSPQPFLPPGVSCVGLYTGGTYRLSGSAYAGVNVDSKENVGIAGDAYLVSNVLTAIRDFYLSIPFDGLNTHNITSRANPAMDGEVRVFGHLKGYIDQRGRDWVSGPGAVEWSRFFNF